MVYIRPEEVNMHFVVTYHVVLVCVRMAGMLSKLFSV
jgi:hypothetical protein